MAFTINSGPATSTIPSVCMKGVDHVLWLLQFFFLNNGVERQLNYAKSSAEFHILLRARAVEPNKVHPGLQG